MESGRRQQRTRLIYHLRVFDEKQGELLGHLLDLTPEGMMLLGERPLEPETRMTIRMKLPGNVMGGGSISFRAKVKWSRSDADGAFVTSGLEVQDLTQNASRIIERLIETFYEEPGEDVPNDDLEKYL